MELAAEKAATQGAIVAIASYRENLQRCRVAIFRANSGSMN
jgi:hypothetical protein